MFANNFGNLNTILVNANLGGKRVDFTKCNKEQGRATFKSYF